jgi:hypothetical protein
MIYSLTVTLTACRSEILGASMLCRVLWNGKRQRVQQIVIHLYNIWSDQGKIVHPFFKDTKGANRPCLCNLWLFVYTRDLRL